MTYSDHLETLLRMHADLVAAEDELRSKLALAEYRRRALEDTIVAFKSRADAVPGSAPAQLTRATEGPRAATQRDAVLEAVRSLLVNGTRLSRQEIARRCVERGVLGSQKSPVKRLATILSSARDEFVSDGKGNYTLRASESGDSRTDTPGGHHASPHNGAGREEHPMRDAT